MMGCIQARKETSKSIEADIRSVEFTLEKRTKYTNYIYTEFTIHYIDRLLYSSFQKFYVLSELQDLYCYCIIKSKFKKITIFPSSIRINRSFVCFLRFTYQDILKR